MKFDQLKLYLNIFQLEEYQIIRFIKWIIEHPLPKKLEGKKPLVWTSKARFLYRGSLVLLPITIFLPWLSLVVMLLILKPYEIINRELIKQKTRKKIDELKKQGLKIIGISGSYGKTSTKEFLYQILKTKYQVLRTPGNYNTLFGIAKVVDLELDGSYDYFICELGSYRVGETWELCTMVDPDYAVLTGLNEQHLERFGSLENEVEGESESLKYVLGKIGQVVANLGNQLVKKRWANNALVIGYGEKSYEFPWQQNIDGASTMAKLLGMSEKEVNKACQNLKRPPHRLTLMQRGEMTIIDDAYSSNTDGFRAAITYLKSFSGWKVLVTPGIPELGKETVRIHRELGKLLVGLDQVILVGNNERTKGLMEGFGREVEYIDKVTEAINKIKKTKATILFENDLPDNY